MLDFMSRSSVQENVYVRSRWNKGWLYPPKGYSFQSVVYIVYSFGSEVSNKTSQLKNLLLFPLSFLLSPVRLPIFFLGFVSSTSLGIPDHVIPCLSSKPIKLCFLCIALTFCSLLLEPNCSPDFHHCCFSMMPSSIQRRFSLPFLIYLVSSIIPACLAPLGLFVCSA